MADVTVTNNDYRVDAMYQWDLNQELVIHDLPLPGAPEVHFAHDDMDFAIVRQAEMDASGVVRVTVPNSLLQEARRINAYVCIGEGETFQTLYKIVIPVIGRAQPSDYEGTNDVEVYSLDALQAEVFTLGPDEVARVEKVLQGDTWTLRFYIPRVPPTPVFVGTQEQYETADANGEIPDKTVVIITDDEDGDGPVTALLGFGFLGNMFLD